MVRGRCVWIALAVLAVPAVGCGDSGAEDSAVVERDADTSSGTDASTSTDNTELDVERVVPAPDQPAALVRHEGPALVVDRGDPEVMLREGDVVERVRSIFPDGVDNALELIGTPTLPDTLAATRVHGVVCFTGMLSNEWTVKDFYPIEYLPRGVRLTAYGGDATDLAPDFLQGFLDAVRAGRATVPIHQRYQLDDIAQAHADMEAGTASGKLVVTLDT